jgi:penicillin-binding protein 1A
VRTLLKLLAVIIAASAVLTATVAGMAFPMSLLGSVGSGEPAAITLDPLEQRSHVYNADGSLLATLHDEINRQPVALEDVPEDVVSAILAVEDQRFWVHEGVDARGTLRALVVNVGEGDIAQGGSTLTQQLVKLAVLGDEQTMERKVQEMVLAHRLEQEMSKEEILTRYLNAVYFGNSAYGIQAAAETYFGVSTEDLDIGQAALLAGMIRNPTANDPIRYPEAAAERRRAALEQLEREGIIDANEVTWFDATPLPTELNEAQGEPDDYFAEEVKRLLLRDNDNKYGLGEAYEDREHAVFQGGLRIFTTFDPRAQQAAEGARNQELPGEEGVFDVGVDPETGEALQGTAAIVSVEPATGAVRAMVGGPGFDHYQYNLVTQNLRQGGSAHKTFVLTSLMEQEYSPLDVVDGSGPCRFRTPEGDPEPYYEVQNFGGGGGGMANIIDQTTRSSNCAYVRLGLIAGLENVMDVAKRLGVSSWDDRSPVQSLPLGTLEMTPLEMAAAYAALGNDGVYNEPYLIERIETSGGRVLYEHTPDPQRAVSEQTARLVTSILEANVRSGTGTAAAIPGHPAAGKTGTAQDSADAWFVGYTRHLSTAVWVGGMGGRLPIRLDGSGITGGSYPARIWGAYMRPLHEGAPVAGFEAPGQTRAPTFLRVPGGRDLTERTRDDDGGNAPPPEQQVVLDPELLEQLDPELRELVESGQVVLVEPG